MGFEFREISQMKPRSKNIGIKYHFLGIILRKEVDIFLKELNLIGKETIFLLKE